MRTWYTFSAKADQPEVAELSIFDYIGYYGVEAKQFHADLSKITADTINVSINSPGGDVFQAVSILNMLRSSGKTINMTVLGIAASAASYILLAGHKRTMPDNAMQMLHNASAGAYGNAAELGELVDVLNKVDANLHATFVSRTGQSAEKIAELLSKDTYLTAEECLELGLCDEVVPAIKVTAAFETAALPEHVQSLFKAAQEAPAEELFADKVVALAVKAGLEDHAQLFALDASLSDIPAVESALANAREVIALCKVAKVDATQHLRTPLSKVRELVCAARAAADEKLHIDTSQPAGNKPAASNDAKVTTSGIWQKIRNR